MKKKNSLFRVLLYVLTTVAAMAVVFEATRPFRSDNRIDRFVDGLVDRSLADAAAENESAPVYFELPADSELDGFLVVSAERQKYNDDEMTLIIPSLDFNQAVRAGTSQAQLKIGPGLFEASGMPGEADANVSIAAHRSHGQFYYLDQLDVGDRIYIVYNSQIYTYVFYDRKDVLPSDWSVISGQGFDSCTLITCTPIIEANKRMVVRFVLESVESASAYF